MTKQSVQQLRRVLVHANFPNIVRDEVRQHKGIIFGSRSVERQLPDALNRPTFDFDVFIPKPRRRALELERRLDRAAGGNVYITKPALRPRTFKVVNRFTKQNVADFQDPRNEPRPIPNRTIGMNRYSTLAFEIMKRRAILRNPEFAFRHDKARDDLRRIRALEFLRRGR
jgi:hypothetical protein